MQGDDTYRYDDDVTMRIEPRDHAATPPYPDGPTRPVTSAPRQRGTMAFPRGGVGPVPGAPETVAFADSAGTVALPPPATGPHGTIATGPQSMGPHGTIATGQQGYGPQGTGPHGTIATGPRGTGPHGTIATGPRGSGPHGTIATGPQGTVVTGPHSTTRMPTGGISLRIGKGVVVPPPTRADRAGNRSTSGRVVRVISGVLTVVLIAGVAWTGWNWWQWWTNRAQVTSVSVAAAPQPGCDVEFDVVGTVYTNGKPGKIAFQWERSDGRRTGTLTQTVKKGETSTAIHLLWKFSGEGAATVTAKLFVVAPNKADASTTFNYSCP